MFKIVDAFLGREGIEGLTDGVPEGIDGSFGGLSERGLELCEGHLDRIEVRRIGRQVEEVCAPVLDGLADAIDLMAAQVVHDDDVTRAERRSEHLLDIGLEDDAVHRSVDHQWRRDRVVSKAGDEGGGLPMAVGYGANQALALRAAAIQARHVGLGPGLVDEDELGWIKRGLIAPPSQARGGHVRPVLLGGVHGFF